MTPTLCADWSVAKFAAELVIDGPLVVGDIIAVDCETDEKDNFVGFAYTTDGKTIRYRTVLGTEERVLLAKARLIGHNLKADVKWLKMWGVDIKPENLMMDTMLMSYVQDPTREKHGLKALASGLLGIEYPSYSDIVGKGRRRVTLDQQATETVANYCGLDVLSTYRLYTYFLTRLTTTQKALVETLEMPLMRLLYRMELLGIGVDVPKLRELCQTFGNDVQSSLERLCDYKNINWGSPLQVKKALADLKLESTDRKELSKHTTVPIVKELLNFRELTKLKSTYIDALLEKQRDGRIYTTFNQIIDTGRLSSYGPNLQNIPTRTDRGNLLRSVFVAPARRIFVDADYSQIEYRLLAHFTQEPILVKAFQEGKDVHEETANSFGVSRYIGKVLNFAAIYGAGLKKITQTINSQDTDRKITENEVSALLDAYWKKLPRVRHWIEKIKEEARSKACFRTLSGQYHKLQYIYDADRKMRWHSERQAVNGVIQGSAAYVIKLAMLELERQGRVPLLQVHDELLFEVEQPEVTTELEEEMVVIKGIMEDVVQLTVPLSVEVGYGLTWSAAKENSK